MDNGLTVSELISKYLTWCSKHRSPRTLEWYEGYLRNFLSHLGEAKHLSAESLKPFHVIEWVDAQTGWGDNYCRGAIVAVQRAYNWAEEMGHIAATPLKKIKKPCPKRRELYTTPDDFEAVLSCLGRSDPFRDLFVFAWHTGARPQECRHIEPRHVELENERIVFPAEESKGKRTKRIIYLQGPALEIIQRLLADGREGKLFLNRRGLPWSKFAVCNRMYRMSQRLGKRLIMYGSRHGFCQRKLIQGHQVLVVAQLMGHSDATMVSKVYSHLDKTPDLLKKALAD